LPGDRGQGKNKQKKTDTKKIITKKEKNSYRKGGWGRGSHYILACAVGRELEKSEDRAMA
jgi:hypothetical protein